MIQQNQYLRRIAGKQFWLMSYLKLLIGSVFELI